ncbi:EAL domain-containing protein [Svornostia abyssi]|uniref:EAL domain-containing protein n=1 Tax=Svornostia abyssi TaxID=2898438 RepID=A0ABY5PHF2_9ACTN|nr:EAL domain-containing protein [Parviterribacteraceae bacterium J379]
MKTSPSTDDAAELDRILGDGLLSTVYQPIVDLETSETVAYEALARGPEGSELHRPERMFEVAREAGRVAELDWACRASALRGVRESGLRPPYSLFVNVEPDAAGVPAPPELRGLLDWARAELHLVVELTERALTARPSGVLAGVPFLRNAGVAIALDDVGVDARSLALMPFLHPEVLKLDMRLVQESPDRELAATVHAVAARAEAAGTLVLAEGIETEAHLERARALGARHGQGWLFGPPGPAPADAPLGLPLGRFAMPHGDDDGAPPKVTPFTLVSERIEPRVAEAGLLTALARELEDHALAAGSAGVLLAAGAGCPGADGWARYRELAGEVAFVGVLGDGLASSPEPGVRTAPFRPDDVLADEWTVCVISPHVAAAMTARAVEGADGADARFRYCLTYDRDLVCGAARTLMARIGPAR